jgi:hypothetical protein
MWGRRQRAHRGQYRCLEKHKLSQLHGVDPIWSPKRVKMLCQHLCYCWIGNCESWCGGNWKGNGEYSGTLFQLFLILPSPYLGMAQSIGSLVPRPLPATFLMLHPSNIEMRLVYSNLPWAHWSFDPGYQSMEKSILHGSYLLRFGSIIIVCLLINGMLCKLTLHIG